MLRLVVISLVCFNMKQFLSLPQCFMTVTSLNNIGQLSCRTSLNLRQLDVSLWLASGYVFISLYFRQKYHRSDVGSFLLYHHRKSMMCIRFRFSVFVFFNTWMFGFSCTMSWKEFSFPTSLNLCFPSLFTSAFLWVFCTLPWTHAVQWSANDLELICRFVDRHPAPSVALLSQTHTHQTHKE